MPVDLSDEELEMATLEANAYLEDESDRAGNRPPDSKKSRYEASIMTDADLAFLRKKFPFLVELSDSFVRSQTTGELLKMESTAMKIRVLEQSRDYEDRLTTNKMSLEEREKSVPAGIDNRWDRLHPGRFLPGATCSVQKLWLEARKASGLAGGHPVGSYDMGAVGMGGFVTSKGWCEMHNPGSCKLSLKLFSINNCAAKSSSKHHMKSGEEDEDNICDLGEFKLAIRTMRVAASMVLPWNFAFVALENFLLQSNYLQADLQHVEQPAKLLTQFVDYVLRENSNRWRDGSGFLDTGSLRSTWDAFFGAKPQAQLASRAKTQALKSQDNKPRPQRKWVDICFEWNAGKCTKAAGACVSSRGTPLRHICNFRADRNKPDIYCGKPHMRTSSH